jgi:hypothetical protein
MKVELEIDKTLEAVDQAIVQANPPSARNYLGMSGAGEECERKIWYRWRWAFPEHFDAATLRRFEDGHRDEDLMAKRLRAVKGIRLETGYADGSQYEVADFNGHFLGHTDGAITGVAVAPKTMHIWEHKCVNQTKFNKLNKLKGEHGEKSALEQWDTTYYAQCQLYLGYTKLKRHYLTVATPGGRDITSCRTDYDAAAFKFFKNRAKSILQSEEAPPRISKKPDYFQCRWCNFSETCHGDKVAQVNCRTCAFSTPVLEETAGAPGKTVHRGAWRCERHGQTIGLKKQRQGCGDHIFIPDLVPFGTAVKMDEEAPKIVYVTEDEKVFVNATKNAWDADPMEFTSKDLQHLTPELMSSEQKMFQAMAAFQTAQIESIKKKPEGDGVPFDDPIPF